MLIRIQKFISDLVLSVLTLLKVLLLTRRTGKMPEPEAETGIILGNGPSLKTTLSQHASALQKFPLFAVNQFAESDAYIKLKPAWYVMQAPAYFLEEAPTPLHGELRDRLYAALAEKTSWPMTLLVPVDARQSAFFRTRNFHGNTNIRIRYYNPTPVEGFRPLRFLLYRTRLGMPRPHNVLIPAMMCALAAGFRTILITGADHSWHEEIRVDSENRTVVNHEHFYDSGKDQFAMHHPDGRNFYIHDVFRKLYLAFSGYHEIADYARKQGARILNASEKTYIDAFDRIQLTDYD